VSASKYTLDELFEQKRSKSAQNRNGQNYTVTFTEKELLAAALKQAEGVDPSSVALSFEPGVAKLWLDIGEILKQNKENNELNFPLDLSIFEGVILSADLVSIDNGTGLSVENLTTGNPLVDSLIPSD